VTLPVNRVGNRNEVWLYARVEAEDGGWAAMTAGERRVEVRKTGRGERSGASGSRLIRGCQVTIGGDQAVDASLTA
jgi:hypothetical protein